MQLNVSKKQREMVLLEDSLHSMRSRFNSRFLSLRSIKREILATVASDNKRLREIDAELGGGEGGEGASFGATYSGAVSWCSRWQQSGVPIIQLCCDVNKRDYFCLLEFVKTRPPWRRLSSAKLLELEKQNRET